MKQPSPRPGDQDDTVPELADDDVVLIESCKEPAKLLDIIRERSSNKVFTTRALAHWDRIKREPTSEPLALVTTPVTPTQPIEKTATSKVASDPRLYQSYNDSPCIICETPPAHDVYTCDIVRRGLKSMMRRLDLLEKHGGDPQAAPTLRRLIAHKKARREQRCQEKPAVHPESEVPAHIGESAVSSPPPPTAGV